VRDRGLHRHIRDVVLEAYLRDDRAYVMSADKYVVAPSAEPPRLNAQRFLLDWYTDASRDDLTMFS
jgi:hypothetical protein